MAVSGRYPSFVLVVTLLSLLTPCVIAQEEERYELSKEGGFSPYVSVTYKVRVSAGLGTVSVAKVLPGAYGSEERAAMVHGEALQDLLSALKPCREVAALKSPRRPRRTVSAAWTLVLERGGERASVKFSDPELLDVTQYQRCLDTLRERVEAQTGAVAFRNVFFKKGEFGYLQVSSDPVARVIINGVDTGQESPLVGIPMSVGDHEVEFVDQYRGVRRRYSVKIMPDMTTNLSVDLR